VANLTVKTINQVSCNAEEEKARISRIVFLDWLRIVAFLSVFVGHKYVSILTPIAHDPNVHATLRMLLEFIFPLLLGGGAGIIIFFLVSGYIITQVIFKERTLEFIAKRFFRIYPLYIVAVLMQVSLNYFMSGQFVGWSVLLKQLTLFGDFFKTYHSLGGVEWTLRVEILFYLTMAILKQINVLYGKFQFALPYVLVALTAILFKMPPFPGRWAWNYGYVNLYAPFLILGVVYYLFENSKLSALFCTAFTLSVLLEYWLILPGLQPVWINSHFVLYGFGVFYGLWLLRATLILPGWAYIISEVTYSFYLFHNWLYDGFFQYVSNFNLSPAKQHFVSAVLLFGFCVVVTRSIERSAIRIGRVFCLRFVQS
jgi:peptidoglycan/LPS O-acetylase OafA/YrhL